MRTTVRRLLAWGVVLSLLLPVTVSVVAGLAALLAALGDAAAATACGRLALALGVAWLVALAATATTGGVLALDLAEVAERHPGAGVPAASPAEVARDGNAAAAD